MIAKNPRALELACDTLDIEADALRKMRDRLAKTGQDALVLSVALLEQCRGRIVVSGIGKSGHIARKIAATLHPQAHRPSLSTPLRLVMVIWAW